MQNGGPSSPSPSPFAHVTLAVDAYTLDAASGKRRLRAVEPDGTLTYDEEKAPRAKRTEALERIWNEYPNGLLELREETLRTADPDTVYGESKDEEVEATETRATGALMAADEMEALRSEVYANLNDARNEMWFILELAKTLAASSGMTADPPPEPFPPAPGVKKGKKGGAGAAAASGMTSVASSVPPPATAAEGDAPILPAGTYSTTPGAAPARPAAAAAHALELALAAKQAALDECASLIDAAVDELQTMNAASEGFSTEVHALRTGEGGGQWAVVPKPDYARGAAGAPAGEMATDVVVPYALDEAPAALRARSIAAFDLDPHKTELAFGARSFMRIQVRLKVGNTETASNAYDAASEGTNVSAALEAAQIETVDEDLFAELRQEAARLDAAVEQQKIVLRVGRDKLTFLLYDTREPPSTTRGAVCDALLAAARVGLLQAYSRRKQRLLDPSMPLPSSPPSILLPIAHVLQFHIVMRSIHPALVRLCGALTAAGIPAVLRTHQAAAEDALAALLAGRAKVDVLGAVFTLEIDGCPGLTIYATAPATISVVTPRATFQLRDPEALAGIAAEAVEAQLARAAMRGLGGTPAWYDELEECVVAAGLGAVSISIPAPYNALTASVENDAVPRYSSRGAAQTWDEWWQDVARAIPDDTQGL